MRDDAVSPLIGFILLMAIVMGMIGILQSTAVPEWNKAVEIRHLSTLKYDFEKIGEVISNSNRNPSKVVLKAGVDYPNYYILFSPPKASTTIYVVNLSINITDITGTQTVDAVTSAIVVEPNYLYSSKSKLVYEHSAVFRVKEDTALVESNQSSFLPNQINLNIIKAGFPTFATTETATIVLIPISKGKSVFSGSIRFESYNEKTAELWENILSSMGLNFVREGKNITIQADNIVLSISIFKAYVGDVYVHEDLNLGLRNTTPLTQSVLLGSALILGAKVMGDYGPVEGIPVSVTDSCNENLVLNSNQFGEVWYSFRASREGQCTISFSIGSSSLEFTINVLSVPTPSGDGAFEINWYKDPSGATIKDYEWDVSQIGNQTELFVRVVFRAFGSPMPGIPIYFTLNDTSILTINHKYDKTNSTGWAKVNLTALNNGTSAIAVIVGNSFESLNVTVKNVGPANRPPTQPSISTDKKYYRSGETITATAYGSTDPDGDPITYYYKFYDSSDGRLLRDWSTTNTYTVTTSEEAHVIRVYAKACDNNNACGPENYADVGIIKVIEIRDQLNISDSYVRSAVPAGNYGSSTTLFAGRGAGEIYRTFVKFTLPQYLSEVKILNASLYLYKSADTGTPTGINLGAHRVLVDWSETTINWNNQPGVSQTPTASVTPPTTNNLYLRWDVTSDVQAFVDGTPNYGWCIKSSNENQNRIIRFNSKENGNANTRPYLYIEYAPKVD